MPFQILVHHRYYANREITGNTTAYLEKTNALAAGFQVEVDQRFKTSL